MKMLKVESSTIKSIGYDYEFGVLEVKFQRDVTYRYENVPIHVVCQMLFKADSIGSYFNKNIAKVYDYE